MTQHVRVGVGMRMRMGLEVRMRVKISQHDVPPMLLGVQACRYITLTHHIGSGQGRYCEDRSSCNAPMHFGAGVRTREIWRQRRQEHMAYTNLCVLEREARLHEIPVRSQGV
jgi:hypothetical protein